MKSRKEALDDAISSTKAAVADAPAEEIPDSAPKLLRQTQAEADAKRDAAKDDVVDAEFTEVKDKKG